MDKKNILSIQQNTPAQAPRSMRDCARLCKALGAEVATLHIKQLQAFWLAIMADKSASLKDRLQASRLYADSIGAFDKHKNQKGINGANIYWRSKPIEAEIVQEE